MSQGSWSRAAAPLALFVAAFAPAHADEPAVGDDVVWHDGAALKQAVDALVGAHKDLARVGSYGKSLGGRDLWFVELGAIDDPQRTHLPALLVVAGIDGQHLVGTELVLDHLKRLVEGYGGEEKAITKLLDEHVVYLIPRANPDGAEAFFHPANGALREVRGNLRPVDDDRDGQIDEDGPEDLNHDGVITTMRWKDPAGTLIEDPAEPRILRPADPLKGERGVYKQRIEGLDRDGDGEWAEDGPGDVVPDRNFPQRWAEHDPAAGRVPLSEPEAKALAQFVFERPALALTIVYGLRDNLAVDAKQDPGGEQPQGFRFNRTMPGGIVKDDQPLYAELATRYRDTTGVKSKPPLDNDDGSFAAFEYFQFGVPALCMHVWSPPLDITVPPKPGEAPKEGEAKKEGEPAKEGEAKKEGGEAAKPADVTPAPAPAPAPTPQAAPTGGPPGGRRGGGRRGGGAGGPGGPGGPGGGEAPAETPKADPDEKKLLIWNDQKLAGAAFLPWTKVAHPTLGEVEVGGWRPYAKVNPPLAEVAELAKKHGDFLVKAGGLFAQVRLADLKVENLGDGLFKVSATVVNEGWLPTVTGMGERNRRARATRLDLDLGPNANGVKKVTLVQGEQRHTWSRIEGGGGRRELRWLVQAPAGGDVTLKLWSERAGDDERVVTLR